jgi:uncharacterized protein YjiS (DUF1127 family)
VSTQVIRHPEAAVLNELAVFLSKTARELATDAHNLDAWLEARRLAANARRDLTEMSDRELRDIGLDRADIRVVASGGSPRTMEEHIRALAFEAAMRS